LITEGGLAGCGAARTGSAHTPSRSTGHKSQVPGFASFTSQHPSPSTSQKDAEYHICTGMCRIRVVGLWNCHNLAVLRPPHCLILSIRPQRSPLPANSNPNGSKIIFSFALHIHLIKKTGFPFLDITPHTLTTHRNPALEQGKDACKPRQKQKCDSRNDCNARQALEMKLS
jgi:hypothetical protein